MSKPINRKKRLPNRAGLASNKYVGFRLKKRAFKLFPITETELKMLGIFRRTSQAFFSLFSLFLTIGLGIFISFNMNGQPAPLTALLGRQNAIIFLAVSIVFFVLWIIFEIKERDLIKTIKDDST
jgi:hypothetical protein